MKKQKPETRELNMSKKWEELNTYTMYVISLKQTNKQKETKEFTLITTKVKEDYFAWRSVLSKKKNQWDTWKGN